jgi:hypothetical protein
LTEDFYGIDDRPLKVAPITRDQLEFLKKKFHMSFKELMGALVADLYKDIVGDKPTIEA